MKKFAATVLIVLVTCSALFAAGDKEKKSEISNVGNEAQEVVATTEVTVEDPAPQIQPISQNQPATQETQTPKADETKTLVLSVEIPGVRVGYIYKEDIEYLMGYYYYYYGMELSAEDAINALVADELYAQGVIMNNLILTQEQKDMLFNYQKASVEQAYGQTFTNEEFDALLQEYYGMTSKEYSDYLADQYILNFYVTNAKPEFFENIPEPTEEIAAQYLEENKTTFAIGENVKLSHIYIPFGEDKEAAKAKADAALAEIKGGNTSFEKAVVIYSEDADSASNGGAIGWLYINDTANLQYMGSNFFKGVFALDAGEISDVLESNVGYHIVKVDVHNDWQFYGMNDTYQTNEDGSIVTIHDYIWTLLPDYIYNRVFQNAYNSLISDLYEMAVLTGFEAEAQAETEVAK